MLHGAAKKLRKKKSREGLREQIYGCWAGSGEGRKDSQRVWDGHAHTAIFKWITNKDLLYSTGNSAHCDVAGWTGGEFGGEWIHVYAWLSPFAAHLKLSQHCSLAIPQYKIKSSEKKKNGEMGMKTDFFEGKVR